MCAKHSDPKGLQLNSLSGPTLRKSVESPKFWFSTISMFDSVSLICLLAPGPILHCLWTEFLPFVLSQSHSWVPKKRQRPPPKPSLGLREQKCLSFFWGGCSNWHHSHSEERVSLPSLPSQAKDVNSLRATMMGSIVSLFPPKKICGSHNLWYFRWPHLHLGSLQRWSS